MDEYALTGSEMPQKPHKSEQLNEEDISDSGIPKQERVVFYQFLTW